MFNYKYVVAIGCISMVFAGCGVTIERYEALQKQHQQCTADLSRNYNTLTKCDSDLKSANQQAEELATKTKTYEELVGNLKEEIEQGKVKISQIQDKLSVNLIDKVLFNTGSSSIQSEGKGVLKKIAGVLKNIKDKRIQVQGHTDDSRVGSAKNDNGNWDLSVLRATSVVKFLTQSGVSEEKISAAGFAQFMPIASNKTEDGKRRNRRIEIILLPEMKIQDASKLDQ